MSAVKSPVKPKKKEKTSITYIKKESMEQLEAGEKELKNKSKALAHFLEAVNIWQENHEAHAHIAEILLDLNEKPNSIEEAYQHITKAIHYNQKSARYRYIKGKIHFKSRQWEDAITEFKEANAERVSEKETIYLYMIAESYSKQGKYNEAIENYREAEKAIAEYEQNRGRTVKYLLESRQLADVICSVIGRRISICYTSDAEEPTEKRANWRKPRRILSKLKS
eukprot:TRINITY_DN12608_c0_g1_i6.p2 TRINITY_DN12608_c0_g1~~TRINITY_DN12608_c0_g1_i6.p2  ORF type:complete len:247 (+),score=57.91 TRINITY_DN12608_c0_g1_i6:70-741(+)